MIVLVHGYDGSGPGHWQRWLASELAARGTPARFPDLPDPTEPAVDRWVEPLAAMADEALARGEEVVFVAHSLGCWAVDHLVARRGARGVRAALLVAPPSPYSLFEPIQSFLPPPRSAAAWAPIAGRSLLVGSDDDEHAAREELEELAGRLAVPFHFLPGAGHVNAAAGFGPWPFALDWVSAAAG